MARAEWRAHWPLVLAAIAGLSIASISMFTMGLFLSPLQAEFAWSQTQLTFGLTLFAIFSTLLSPLVGRLLDRWGARRLAIPGVALTGLGFAAFSLATESIILWWTLWIIFALASLAVQTTTWTAAVSKTFHHSRGIAIAITLAGTNLGGVAAPLIARALIDNHGWRSAYLWIGLGWAAFALLLIIPFFFDPKDRARVAAARSGIAETVAALMPGLSFAEAIRSPVFQRLCLVVFTGTALLSAVVIHMVPILTSNGLTRETAAGAASLYGLAALAGKLGIGAFLDRTKDSRIPAMCLLLPILSCAILLTIPPTTVTAMLSVAIFGFCAGASLASATYLTTRYVGMKAFGQNFGILASLMALASGVGPLSVGWLHDNFGSYDAFLIIGIPLSIVNGVLMLSLGRFPHWPAVETVGPAPPPPLT